MAEVSDTAAVSWPRIIAVVLALGGLFWSVFLLLLFGPAVMLQVSLLAGYLVTAGYIVRAVSVPTLVVRRMIWAVSLLVQGGFLLLVGIPDLSRTGPNLAFAWWAFASVCSLVAIAAERENGLPKSVVGRVDNPPH